MGGQLDLPTEKDALLSSLESAISQAILQRNIASVEWSIAHFYLQGYRDIDIVSWKQGDVRVSFESDQGELKFANETLLHQFRTELGRFLRMHTGPVVSQEGFGLQSVRSAGIAHATLRHMSSQDGVHGVASKQTLSRFVNMLLKYGTAGLHHYRVDGKTLGARTAVDPVPPWEILFIPAELDHEGAAQGIMRHRVGMSLEWVKKLAKSTPGFTLPKDLGQLSPQSIPFGVAAHTSNPELGWRGSGYGTEGGGTGHPVAAANEARRTQVSRKTRQKDESIASRRDQKVVTVTEVWTYDPHEFVRRYIIKIGKHIALDEDYSKMKDEEVNSPKVICPLPVARCIPTGRAYGRSWVGALLAINYEAEKMLSTQFQNVADQDMYPIIVVPAESGISKRQMNKRERRKILFAQTDPVVPDSQVYAVAPFTQKDTPLKTAAFAMQVQEKQSGQGELFTGGAPGRVDSASALGFLWETGNIGLVATTHEIANAYTQAYASMLQAAKREADADPEQKFSLPLVDDRMIGIKIDAAAGTIGLQDNPLPEPWEVAIAIEEMTLQSKEQKRQEAGQMVEAGVISLAHFRILNERDGLGWPVLNRADYESWRKAVIMKILLFNDGETPGPKEQIIGGAHSDRPTVILEVLEEFMASIEYMVASQEVREAFIVLKGKYKGMLAQGFPGQLRPEDAAMAMQQGSEGGGPPGGQPPPGPGQGGPPPGMVG